MSLFYKITLCLIWLGILSISLFVFVPDMKVVLIGSIFIGIGALLAIRKVMVSS